MTIFDYLKKNCEVAIYTDEYGNTYIVTDLMSCHGFAHMNCHQIDWFSVISQPHRAAA